MPAACGARRMGGGEQQRTVAVSNPKLTSSLRSFYKVYLPQITTGQKKPMFREKKFTDLILDP
jgi:hypothetical protein